MALSSQPHYEIIEDAEWNYSFVTKHGIVYHAYFIDFSEENLERERLVSAFYDLVKNNFYPVD